MGDVAEAPLYLAIFVNAALPGPCAVLALARTAAAGPVAGGRVTAGVLAGVSLVTLLAFAVMLGAIGIADGALTVMKWVGVVVLLGLALRTLAASLRPTASGPRRAPVLAIGDAWAGASVVLCSPSVLVFLLAMLPQFLVEGTTDLRPALRASGVFLAGVAAAQAVAVGLGAWSIRLGSGSRRWADRASGLLLVAFAGMAAFAG